MNKIDFKKELKQLYSPAAKSPILVEVPDMKFLMIDGEGDPNTSEDFPNAIETLYGLSYKLKFMLKSSRTLENDYVVPPLEGLWWTDDMNQFSVDNKSIWKWTMMIMQPEFILEEHVGNAIQEVKAKKEPPNLTKVRFERYYEGLSAQIMHLGPYSEEKPTIDKLHSFILDKGYKMQGKHHEIYLSDPRKSVPEKMKTIIRQPVGK